MSCPHFEPLSPLDRSSWRARLRPPLGMLYAGVCRCAQEPFHPEGEMLTDNCNMGYASGQCPHFRPGSGDAVRFSIARTSGADPVVRWLVESAGLPVLSGELPCAEVGLGPIAGAPAHLAAQLRAYVASYRSACAKG